MQFGVGSNNWGLESKMLIHSVINQHRIKAKALSYKHP